MVITREAVVSNGVKYSGLYHKATSVFKMFTACSPSVVASEIHDSGSCVLASLPCEEEQSKSLAWAAPPSGGASGGACSGLFFLSPFGSASPPSSSTQGSQTSVTSSPRLLNTALASGGGFLERPRCFLGGCASAHASSLASASALSSAAGPGALGISTDDSAQLSAASCYSTVINSRTIRPSFIHTLYLSYLST